MGCLTCGCVGHHRFRIGDRVTVSRMEQCMLGKDLKGMVVDIGHLAMRKGTAKVKWDNGHKDQWWPLNCLYLLIEAAGKAPGLE